jgi:hypothetical protein
VHVHKEVPFSESKSGHGPLQYIQPDHQVNAFHNPSLLVAALMQGYILFYNQSFIITKRKMQMMHTNF